MLNQQTITLEDIKNKSIEEIIKSISTTHQILIVQLPNGEEVIIQPKPQLKPLHILEGYVPEGWKEAIYDESE